MKRIYEAQIRDCEGRSTLRREYFMNEDDAKKFVGFTPEGSKSPGNTNWIVALDVWENSEYSDRAVLRNSALAKLTNAEKEALGLTVEEEEKKKLANFMEEFKALKDRT